MTAWIRRGLAVVGAVVAVPSAMAQRGPVEVLTEADARDTVRVAVGTELVVQLKQAAGTRFRWDMRNDPRLRLIGPPQTEDAPEERRNYGGRQVRTFRVRVTEPGRIPLIFGLRSQTGESDRPAVRRIVFTLDATDDGWIDWKRDENDRPQPRPGAGPDMRPSGEGTLHEWDAGRTLRVRSGREMRILLPDSGSHVGFAWETDLGLGLGISRSSTVDLRVSRSDENVGRLGTEVISLKIVRPGPYDLKLSFRPGGPGTPVARVLRYSFLAD